MTITAPGGGPTTYPAIPTLPTQRSEQDLENRVEEAVVHTLVDDVVESLTDRAGGDHPHPWTPEQRVRVGVLGFTVTPPQPEDGSTSGDDDDTGSAEHTTNTTAAGHASAPAARPIDNPGILGLDLTVEPTADTVTLICEVDYALYQQLWPDYADVLREATEALTAAQGSTVTTRTAASDGESDTDGNSATGGEPIGPGNRRRTRRPMVRTRPTWRRYDRRVTVDITIPIGPDETIVSSRDLAGGDPLVTDAHNAVSTHYALPEAARKLSGPQTLSAREASTDEATFRAAIRRRLDTEWTPVHPDPELTVIAVPTVDGALGVSVSLVNRTDVRERPFQDLSLYDSKLAVTVTGGGHLVHQRLGFAEEDPRYNDIATVAGRGRGCVARGDDNTPDRVWSDTLPIFNQVALRHTHLPGADMRFATLAVHPTPTLDAIAVAMRSFLRGWNPAAASATERPFLEGLRDQFAREVERYELGCDLLARDADLGRAFRLANDAFARANPGSDTQWRLFQVVFIVSQLAALAVRMNPGPKLRAELDAVDVLWFPTGGGKTEAYTGLTATALFYDRLRGKHRGPTAWLLFPLRMLSVQQLARLERVLHHADVVRQAENVPGDPFTLGYLVGSGNTPNRLASSARNGWWPGLAKFASWTQEERDKRRLVGACSACNDQDSVGLDADVTNQRLLHVCRKCEHVLPIHASDEEVFRYMSSVIVSTVDKTASFAYNGEFTALNRGPKHCCLAHGYYTFGKCGVEGCTTPRATPAPPFVDPTPALWIQDELHLVREELGVFASHYHTLLAELAVGAGNLPSKVLAATATIERYEDQLRQVYGRSPRMFPTGGPTLARSFYTEVTDNTRRVYLGVLPAGGGTAKVDVAGQLLRLLIRRVHEHTDDPTELVARLASGGVTITPAEALDVLFRYELGLGYVNSKAHGVNILDDIQDLSDTLIHARSDRILSDFLSGETPIGDLAKIVAAITGATRTGSQRAQRYRALVGTSVVSHGVDLPRLNLQVVAGMPPSYAHYIQATSRAGRTHVGLVVSVFDRYNRRESSVFHSFLTAHEALERMVEPVPVNRFAARAVERTLPGIACSLLWDEAYTDSSAPDGGIQMTRRFKPWWNTVAATLNPTMVTRIRRAYQSPVANANPATAEAKLADDAETRWELERQRMQMFGDDFLTDLFTVPAMTSLRDVEAPVEFGGGARAEQVIQRLLGSGTAAPPAMPTNATPAGSPARRADAPTHRASGARP